MGSAFFVWVACAAFFLPLAGACGLRGFWAWACARDSRDARVRAEGQEGRVARRGQKPRDVARGELSSPPFFGDPKKGGAGAAGARSPRGEAWASRRSALRTAARPTCTGRALAALGTAPTQMR